MSNKGLVQFEEETDAQYLTDAVVKFLGEDGLSDGQVVDVEFGEDEEGEKNVVKIVKGKSPEPKKEELAKDETKPEPDPQDTSSDVYTVAGVSYKYNGITFEEEKDVWYDMNVEEIKAKGIKKGVKVTFCAEAQEGKKNQLITAIEKVEVKEEEKKEPESDKGKEAKNSFDDTVKTERDAFYRVKELERQVRYLKDIQQNSIEAQAAMNAANNLVGKLFTGKVDHNNTDDGTKVKELVKSLAKHNYDVIQELKNNKGNTANETE